MWCRICERTHVMPDCPWDWPGVERKEREARRKADALPRCRLCGRPMWCGQRSAHHTCVKENE